MDFSFDIILMAVLKVTAKKHYYDISLNITNSETKVVDKIVELLVHLKYTLLPSLEEEVFGVWGFPRSCEGSSKFLGDRKQKGGMKRDGYDGSASRDEMNGPCRFSSKKQKKYYM